MSALRAHIHDCDSTDASLGVEVSASPTSGEPVPTELRSGTHSIPSPARASGERRCSAEPPRPLVDTRSQSLQRYLSAQTDIDDEVLQLYKLVCRI